MTADVLVRAEAVRQEMIRTKHDAEKRVRETFQERWGTFYRCTKCMNQIYALGLVWPDDFDTSPCCSAPIRKQGYAPPPDEVRAV